MKNDPGRVQRSWDVPTYSHSGSRSLSTPALSGLTRQILGRGVPFRFSAPGTSMWPFIRDGDIITVAPHRTERCRTGSVVVFVFPGTEKLVVHRVIAVAQDGCRTRGDNSAEDDGMIPSEYITGEVIRIERAGRTVGFGLGPERLMIALLSRWGCLRFLVGRVAAVVSGLRRIA